MPPYDTDLRKLYELSLVFHALENMYHIQNTAQLNDLKEREDRLCVIARREELEGLCRAFSQTFEEGRIC